MKALRHYLRRFVDGQMVRPLALAGPVLVLLIALPLLRPLRHPEQMSVEEMQHLATVRALVEHRSLALDRGYRDIPGVVHTPNGTFSPQPPMMPLLLYPPAWILDRLGISFDSHQATIAYVLTLLGVTLPVAGAAGLVYRMGRLFELRRPIRTCLGIAVVSGSGLLSYAVVLNAAAPAAVLILAAAACLVHVNAMNRDDRRAGWFALGGACTALAATLEPAAIVFVVLLLCVIPTMRFSIPRRIAGMIVYLIGAIPVFALHAAWNIPITDDAIPASVHVAMSNRPSIQAVSLAQRAMLAFDEYDEQEGSWGHGDAGGRSITDILLGHASWLITATVGAHGVLSHFPVLLVGILGIGAVMHRHWPSSTKTLAGATGAGAVLVMALYRMARLDWSGAMFASRWFLIFTPLLLFWAGAWLRRSHGKPAWAAAGAALAFSVAVGLVGATDPTPARGFQRYTAAEAVLRLLGSNPDSQTEAQARADALLGR
ncbi:hypothetical protein [Fontivita pretiosa]|uniref:hypothetical protein n=1 Tax=Fontivita pretiosa TaxID=2989684 RepID=UPI003D175363